jgi:hypothetical protein
MRDKRTTCDFSKHIHTTTIYKNEENEIRVDEFKVPGSRYGYIKFINDSEGMSIFGDYGNWIFCRPFIPSAEGYVSDSYWCEKLRIGSCQLIYDYDSEATSLELERLIKNGLEEYGYEGEELRKIKQWYKDLLHYVDDEVEYSYHAYRSYNGLSVDFEDIPFEKDISIQLKIIFDAFDEICTRIKNNQDENNKNK